MDERYVVEREHRKGNLFTASLWMFGITMLLFFLPFLNGLIGGMVGGFKAGTAMRGIEAALIPALLVALGLAVLMIFMDAPIVGVFTGIAMFLVIGVSSIAVLLGGALGGAISNSTSHRRRIPITV